MEGQQKVGTTMLFLLCVHMFFYVRAFVNNKGTGQTIPYSRAGLKVTKLRTTSASP